MSTCRGRWEVKDFFTDNQRGLLELYDIGCSAAGHFYIKRSPHGYRVVHCSVGQRLRTAKVGILRHLADGIVVECLLAQSAYAADISCRSLTIGMAYNFEVVVRQYHLSLCEVV